MRSVTMMTALAATLVLAAAAAAQQPAGDTFTATFDGPVGEEWFFTETADTEWTVEDGKLFSTSQQLYWRRFAIARFPFTEGVVRFDGVVPDTAEVSYRHLAFGPVGKYIDGENYWFLRAGMYGGMAFQGVVNGEGFQHKFGGFLVNVNAPRTHEVVLRRGRVALFVDGVAVSIVRDPLGGREGFAGVYAGSQCKFDNFTITKTQ